MACQPVALSSFGMPTALIGSLTWLCSRLSVKDRSSSTNFPTFQAYDLLRTCWRVGASRKDHLDIRTSGWTRRSSSAGSTLVMTSRTQGQSGWGFHAIFQFLGSIALLIKVKCLNSGALIWSSKTAKISPARCFLTNKPLFDLSSPRQAQPKASPTSFSFVHQPLVPAKDPSITVCFFSALFEERSLFEALFDNRSFFRSMFVQSKLRQPNTWDEGHAVALTLWLLEAFVEKLAVS